MLSPHERSQAEGSEPDGEHGGGDGDHPEGGVVLSRPAPPRRPIPAKAAVSKRKSAPSAARCWGAAMRTNVPRLQFPARTEGRSSIGRAPVLAWEETMFPPRAPSSAPSSFRPRLRLRSSKARLRLGRASWSPSGADPARGKPCFPREPPSSAPRSFRPCLRLRSGKARLRPSAGSWSPTRGDYNFRLEPRGVAQLAEHRSPKPGVAGSSPAAPDRLNRRNPSS